ncbi:hypothetical protein HBI46_089080 [Parastagonospora nodorum]|nr:hypothetical protein HBH43_054220 [Parastagonospora nodorum]KAH5302940.1 hypothetical protein HBI11_130550 [Parastagonospora nodorum]KAH5420385.1 hypothetical protein HBI46_089080 [Parastagonospora nodorum]KAH5521738.1 hypothetical protein HBI29_057140 [Parastagonospora nodorum]KAH6395374.1 hypothetical protein HBI60_123070 [Parastagonospora nodorum]
MRMARMKAPDFPDDGMQVRRSIGEESGYAYHMCAAHELGYCFGDKYIDNDHGQYEYGGQCCYRTHTLKKTYMYMRYATRILSGEAHTNIAHRQRSTRTADLMFSTPKPVGPVLIVARRKPRVAQKRVASQRAGRTAARLPPQSCQLEKCRHAETMA